METNYPRDYPTDVLPEDRKQERIVELERKLKQAEARLKYAITVLKNVTQGTAPQCGRPPTGASRDDFMMYTAAALERIEKGVENEI